MCRRIVFLIVVISLILGVSPGVAHADGEWFYVDRALSGDTILLTGGFRVRLYGVEALDPATYQCGRVAQRMVDDLFRQHGRRIYLERGPRTLDTFGRALGYAWLYDQTHGWFMIDELLVWSGHAYAWRTDGQYRNWLISMENEARADYRGCLWDPLNAIFGVPPR